MTLPKNKIAVLHVAKKRLAMTDDDYRTMLQVCAGVRSAAELDQGGFETVMQHLAQLGFKSTWRTGNFDDRPGMATPAQVALIRRLWGDFTEGKGTDTSLDKWIAGRFKVSALRFIDAALAPKLITALKNMVAHRSAVRGVEPPPAA